MKKRLILGDLHGRLDNYVRIYSHENPDEVICLGDYVDSFDVSLAKQEYATKELFRLKQEHEAKLKGKFIILLGNHDFHYLYGYPQLEKYSGFSWTTFRWAHPFFTEAIKNKTMQAIFVDYKNKMIYSHAGITNTWINDWELKIFDINDELKPENTLDCFKFTYADYDPYGNSKYASPIWIRPAALLEDMYKDDEGFVWTQFVGHTETKTIEVTEDNKLWCCDSIGHNYYVLQYLDDENKLIETQIVHLP